MAFSEILFMVRSPDIFLKSRTVFGGKTFGIGVTILHLNMSGHFPVLLHVFIDVVIGVARKVANFLLR